MYWFSYSAVGHRTHFFLSNPLQNRERQKNNCLKGCQKTVMQPVWKGVSLKLRSDKIAEYSAVLAVDGVPNPWTAFGMGWAKSFRSTFRERFLPISKTGCRPPLSSLPPKLWTLSLPERETPKNLPTSESESPRSLWGDSGPPAGAAARLGAWLWAAGGAGGRYPGGCCPGGAAVGAWPRRRGSCRVPESFPRTLPEGG